MSHADRVKISERATLDIGVKFHFRFHAFLRCVKGNPINISRVTGSICAGQLSATGHARNCARDCNLYNAVHAHWVLRIYID